MMSDPLSKPERTQRILLALQKDGNLESAQWTCDPPPELSQENVPPAVVPPEMSHPELRVCDCGNPLPAEGTECYKCKKKRQRDKLQEAQ